MTRGRALLLLAVVSLGASLSNTAHQGLLRGAASYAAFLACVAAVLGGIIWAGLHAVLARSPIRAWMVASAALTLTAWLAWSLAGKYATFPIRKNEGVMRNRLTDVRSALSIYAGDHGGAYPPSLRTLVPKYIQELSATRTLQHGESTKIRPLDSPARVSDSGGWAYMVAGQSSGTVYIDCSHTDLQGRRWDSY